VVLTHPQPFPFEGKGVVKSENYRQTLAENHQIAENQFPSIKREGLGVG